MDRIELDVVLPQQGQELILESRPPPMHGKVEKEALIRKAPPLRGGMRRRGPTDLALKRQANHIAPVPGEEWNVLAGCSLCLRPCLRSAAMRTSSVLPTSAEVWSFEYQRNRYQGLLE